MNEGSANAYWDNASIPAAMARFFTEHPYGQNLATLPWMVYVGYALGIAALVAHRREDQERGRGGLWALVAASLLASPIAWHNYLVLLAPGVLLLLARGRVAPALFLLALQAIPAQWPLLWNERGTVVADARAHALPLRAAGALDRAPARAREPGPEPAKAAGRGGPEGLPLEFGSSGHNIP